MTVLSQDKSYFPDAPVLSARAQIDAVVSDLARLEGIVNDAVFELLASFSDIQQIIAKLDPTGAVMPACGAINRAITAMQFHDLAMQLVAGAKSRLVATASVLGDEGALPNEFKYGGQMPINEGETEKSGAARSFPKQIVQQHDVSSGSVDLF